MADTKKADPNYEKEIEELVEYVKNRTKNGEDNKKNPIVKNGATITSSAWFYPIYLDKINDNKDYDIGIPCETGGPPYQITDSKYVEELVPMEIIQKLIEFRKRVDQLRPDFTCIWYVRNPSIRFYYKEQMYEFFPWTIGINVVEERFGAELFEHMSIDMVAELKAMGCPYVSYTGMLD